MSYRFSSWERVVYTGSMALVLTAWVLFLVFLPKDFGSWAWPVSGLLGGVEYLIFRQWTLSWQSVSFQEGFLLIGSVWGLQSLDVKDLVSWSEDPGRGVLTLKTHRRSYKLSRRLRPYDKLKAALMEQLPQYGNLKPPLDLSAVKSSLAVYLVFLMGAVGFVLIFLNYAPRSFLTNLIVGLACTGVLIGLIIRITWHVPIGYRIKDSGLEIRYLLRKKMVYPGDVEQIFTDTHAATGASFFLVRINLTNGRNVILDEMVLHHPLGPVEPLLRLVLTASPSAH